MEEKFQDKRNYYACDLKCRYCLFIFFLVDIVTLPTKHPRLNHIVFKCFLDSLNVAVDMGHDVIVTTQLHDPAAN